jgi:hypothetical protein
VHDAGMMKNATRLSMINFQTKSLENSKVAQLLGRGKWSQIMLILTHTCSRNLNQWKIHRRNYSGISLCVNRLNIVWTARV